MKPSVHTQDIHKYLRPLGRILDLSSQGWTVWDCSPIRGEDGRVHVFATRWRGNDRPDAVWFLGSEIVHAVADRPDGPYEVRDTVIAGNGSDERWDSSGVINPKIYRVANQYCLFYTGCRDKRHDTQAVGMLLADSLDGPWRRVSDSPLLAPLSDHTGFDGYFCNNPAMVMHPSGQVWLYYKGRPVVGEEEGRYKPGKMSIGLAVADQLAGPYRKHSANPVVELAGLVEDPYVWHDGERFWMLASSLGMEEPGGVILNSEDGIAWSPPLKGYPCPKTFCGKQQRLEEPNLLFSDNGRPTHLFNVMGACPEDNVYSGFVFEIRWPD